jgi:DNA helicase HerA-like ATPase
MSVLLWDQLDKEYCAHLVLDPHDEYYGRTRLGLKDHPAKERIEYYSTTPPPGCRTLTINIRLLRPMHFHGAVEWSAAQRDALAAYHKRYGDEWIEALILEKDIGNNMFNEATIGVVKRKLMRFLNLDFSGGALKCSGVFDLKSGMTTISDIVGSLEEAKTVIIDTSCFSGAVEILIGSMITSEVFSKYRYFKNRGALKDKPVVSVVLEEAPRVLGKEVLDKGPNIFSTIAREGRKFKVGLVAITQLPSLIPRQILANMNTKIILGVEMAPERQAIIESASQDLSQDSRAIASLDKGEAIVTSNFARFATPIKIPLFSDHVRLTKREDVRKDFSGIEMG